MPHHRPPPLHLLPALDAAARWQSFAKAAQELHVTAPAISQQIRQLEDWLGVPLFHRLTRQVRLTEAGVQFAALAREVLQRYQDGHAEWLWAHARPRLRLSAAPLVGHELLLPALGAFQAQHPGLDLSLDLDLALADFDAGQVDAAIRFGAGRWRGLTAWPLIDCLGTVAGHPRVLQAHPVRGVADLRHHTLIHFRKGVNDWDLVARALGVEALPHQGNLYLDSELSAMRAAEQGLGLVICILPACQRWLDEGLLQAVAPPMPLGRGYHFVFKAQHPRRDLLKTLHGWLLCQMQRWAQGRPHPRDNATHELV
jgi:LysR family transcriptional regulator, glycine cleavage system transcriptional activator